MVTKEYDKLDKHGKHQIQSIIGMFLYYGGAVKWPILPAFNKIVMHQASPMTDTVAKKTC